MLDHRFIVDHAEQIKENCRRRGVAADVDRFLHLEALRKAKQQEVEQLNRRSNELSKSMGKAKDAAEREALKAEGRALRQRAAELPRDKEIVPFCTISLRGYAAERILRALGFTRVRVLEGGLAAWPYEKATRQA